jgi:hypothetical protein
MKNHLLPLFLVGLAVPAMHAGTPPAKNPVMTTAAEADFGRITLGGKFSEDLQSGYLDVVQGLHVEDSQALFLNLRGTLDDSDQQFFSSGLGYRVLLEDPGVILGANVFYDYINSAADNNFNQLGLGVEALSKWVDVRFNYYLPEDGRKSTGTTTTSSSRTFKGQRYRKGNVSQRDVIRETTTFTTENFEQAVEGWNAEIGFLVPGVEKYFDLRLFAGAYGYDAGADGDLSGFKARAEARVTQNVTLDLEYWADEELVGGNVVAGVRFSSPFDLGKLVQGRNPFKVDNPAPARSLRSRMDEMIWRSHRQFSNSSTPQPGDTSSETDNDTIGTTDQATVTQPTTTPSSGGGQPPDKP